MAFVPNLHLHCLPLIQVTASSQDLVRTTHSGDPRSDSPSVTMSGSRPGLYVLLLATTKKSFERNGLSVFDI